MPRLSTIALLLLTCCNGFSTRDLVNYSLPLDGIMDSLDFDQGQIYIHIDKSDFVLYVMADTMILKQYPVVLGGNPEEDKLHQGGISVLPKESSRSRQSIHIKAGINLFGSIIRMNNQGKNTEGRNRRAP